MNNREVPTEEQIARTYRVLADRFAGQRAEDTRNEAWRRIQHKWHERVRRRSSWWLTSGWRWQLGATAVALAALGLVLLWPQPSDLTYTVSGVTPTGEQHWTNEDGWIRTGNEAADVNFSDGSAVKVDANTSLNVNVLGKHSALTRLEGGRVTARVHHADETNWTFFAGPYEIRVVGTAFDLSWRDSELRLEMHEGQVKVLGPNQSSWLLSKGEMLHRGAPPEQPIAAVAPSDTPSAAPAVEDVTPEASDAIQPVDKAKPAQSWSQMLSKGRFSQIVREAKRVGVSHVHATSSSEQLAALAQAATYTSDAALAESTWKRIRSRFPGSSNAIRGAFFLARLEERQGNSGEALRWLNSYLKDSPGGVFAAEATGRKLVLTRRMRGANSAAAREQARNYLKQFPDGAYAETARATLGHR